MWSKQDTLLYVQHGSTLYGLNHAGSDDDYYRVTVGGKPGQSIIDGVDTTRQPLARWLHQCEQGVPQALEAMFSPVFIENTIPYITNNYVAGMYAMRERYMRTIKSFWLQDTYKMRRHSCRLFLNLQEAHSAGGRFNPRLTDDQKEQIEWMQSHLTDYPTL